MQIKSIYRRLYTLKDILEAISYVCVVLGIGFAAFQYAASIEAERRMNSVSYIQNFQNAEIVTARLQLQNDWLAYPLKAISGRVGSSQVIDDLALSFVFPNGESVRADSLVRVIDYLDVLGTCVKNEVCDKDVVRNHFGSYVQNLSCLYQAPIERLRSEHNLTHLGIGMKELSVGVSGC